MNSPVLYLVPELMNPQSGIARYCRLVCRGLVAAGRPLTVVSRLGSARMTGAEIQNGIEYHPCSGQKALFVGQALSAAMRRRPDVLILGHLNFAPLGWFLARLVDARLVTFMYGIDVFRPLSPWHRWALRRSDIIIAISRFTAHRAAEVNGIDLQKMRILHNCLDPNFEKPLGGQVKEQCLSLLTVGRMSLAEQYKGQDRVIRAMPVLLSRFPGLVYDIVGDGDWRPALENLAQRQGVAGSVHFHGTVSEEELQQCDAYFDGFIEKPIDAETFPQKVLELVSRGRSHRVYPAAEAKKESKPLVEISEDTREALESLEKIRGALSHDLRTPLTVMISYANTVGREKVGDLNEKQREMLDRVVDQGFQMDALISELVRIARESLDSDDYPPKEEKGSA
mgnify:CR=1 FL=1